MLRGHARLDMTPVDVTSMPVGILRTNARGVIYRAELAAGELSGTGTIFRYTNPDARSAGGISVLKLRYRGDVYTITFTAYGDLSAATDSDMRLQIYVGHDPAGRPFITTDAPWAQTSSGWRAPRDH